MSLVVQAVNNIQASLLLDRDIHGISPASMRSFYFPLSFALPTPSLAFVFLDLLKEASAKETRCPLQLHLISNLYLDDR